MDSKTSDTSFFGSTAALGKALLDAPVMRPWPPTLDEARKILADQPYEVLERIGHGGMGAVFKVRNLEPGMGRVEAVKIRRPEARDDELFRERFLREIGTLAQLRHPGITTVYRSGDSAEGYLWFSMEFLEGRSLAELLAPGLQALAPERVLDITRQLCITLQFIHKMERLHRDLKPANVMVCEDGSVRLLDFGIARPAEPAPMGALTRPGENPHTPDFAAPEQIHGGAVDVRSDLYSLGRIITVMIRPDDGSAREGQTRFSQRLLNLVSDLLAFDRKDRPNSAADVFEKLGQIEPGSPGFWGKDRCPFRGLEAYQPEHAEIFFGRDAAIRRGKEILLTSAETAWNGFLLITGASGSGKSSLARAGLGPALLRGENSAASGNAKTALIVCDLGAIRPKNDCLLPPLARLIAAAIPNTASSTLAEALRDSTADLGRFLGIGSGVTPSIQRCLILDQFEHFFRTDLPRNAQFRFLTAIARLASTPGMAVLVTLRSDFYHYCATHPILMDLKDGRQLDVGSPQPWELAAMLRLTARAGGLVFETGPDGRGLDDVLLDHARRNSQVLPLLSYVLEQLWEHRNGPTNTLRFADYEALGGFEGAVGVKAKETLARFVDDFPNDASVAIDDLLHLVVEASNSGNGDTFVRRRASPDELSAAAPYVRQLAERMATARLLVQDSSGITLAHEALLSAAVVNRWNTLGEWLKNHAQDLRVRERVALRCRDWLNHARSGDLLLSTGLLLADVAALMRARPSLFSVEQCDFIQQSAAAAAEQTRRSRRQRHGAFAVLSLLVITACLSVLWALSRGRDAGAAVRAAVRATARGFAEANLDGPEAAAPSVVSVPDEVKTIGEAVKRCKAGGTIKIAGGTYTEALVLTKSVSLVATSAAVFDGRDLRSNLIVARGPILVTLRNLQLKNTQEAARAVPESSPALVLISDEASVRFDGCEIEGSLGNGVALAGKASAVFVNCTLSKNRGHGINVSSASKVEMSQSKVRENGRSGIVLMNVGTAVTLGNGTKVEANSNNGVVVDNGAEIKCSGVTLRGNQMVGIIVDGSGSLALLEAFCVISANRNYGIGVMNAGRVVLSDSAVEDNSGGGLYAKTGALVDIRSCHFLANGPLGASLIDKPSKLRIAKTEFKSHTGMAAAFEQGCGIVAECTFLNNDTAIYYGQGASGSAIGNTSHLGPLKDINDAFVTEQDGEVIRK